jgi:hypothetical protein
MGIAIVIEQLVAAQQGNEGESDLVWPSLT